MKQLLFALTALLFLLCGCQPQRPVDDPADPPQEAKPSQYVCVATYHYNLLVNGEPLLKEENEYAFLPLSGKVELSSIVVATSENKLRDILRVPVECTIEDGKVTYCQAIGKVKEETCDSAFLKNVSLAADFNDHYFVFDGITLSSGKIDLSLRCDDKLFFFDINDDGVFEGACYYPVYNALTVVSADKNGVTLSGGFGSAFCLDAFDGKTLIVNGGMTNPKVGAVINASICVDGSAITMSEFKVTTSETYPLLLSKWTSNTDILNRFGSDMKIWSNAVASTENLTESGRELVKEEAVGKFFTFYYDDAGRVVKAVPAETNKAVVDKLVGAVTLQTEDGKMISGALDMQGLWHSTYNYSAVQDFAIALKGMGLTRMYLIVSNPGYPMYAASMNGYSSKRAFGYAIDYFAEMGYEMNDHSFVTALHKQGIECYAVYKLYEGGGGATAPLGAQVGWDQVAFSDRFGQRLGYEDFLEETLTQGKDYRIVRRADGANDNLTGTVDCICVDFMNDNYEVRMSTAERTKLSQGSPISAELVNQIVDGKTYTNKNQHPSYGINIWVSDDNGTYTLYEGYYSYSYVKTSKVIYNANGKDMFGGIKNVMSLQITGLKIDNNFCAVSFENTSGLLLNVYTMLHIYSGEREIACSTANYVRKPLVDRFAQGDYVWGYESYPAYVADCKALVLQSDGTLKGTPSGNTESATENCKYVEKFTEYGFEFNWYPFGEQIHNYCSVIGVARGKADTLPGCLCEGYEEVREYWLDNVERLCKAGFDGVTIRLQSHSSMSADYLNYGYNEPIVNRYKEKYGVEAYNTLMDKNHQVTDEEFINICRIRGEYLEMFYEGAAEICHDYKIPFGVTMREFYEDPVVADNINEVGWWTMPKVIPDWQKCCEICDFIVIKDYIYTETRLRTMALKTRQYAKSLGKEVWVECYDEQAGMFNSTFLKIAFRDESIDGVMIYEMTGVYDYEGKIEPMIAAMEMTQKAKTYDEYMENWVK